MRNFKRATIAFLIFVIALPAGARGLTDIRHVDFKNFSFPWDEKWAETVPSLWHWINQPPQAYIQTVRGMHHFYSSGQDEYERERAPLVSVDSVTYGDLDGDGMEEAAVHLNYSGGGTANWDFLYVYKLVRGRPKLMAILESGSRADGGLVRTSIAAGLLVLDFADAERRVGDCCSQGYIRVRYRWWNRGFTEEGPRERGDLDLNSL